jgi:NADPH:quinone reductase-like Zn-dependent oxidoreductase
MLVLTWVTVSAFDVNAYGDGAVHGCDFAGMIEMAGSGVTRYRAGDRVAGVIWGGGFSADPAPEYPRHCS